MSWVLDDKQLEKARENGRRLSSEIAEVTYDPVENTLEIAYANKLRFSVPAHMIQGLEKATPEQISRFEISPMRTALSWDDLDVDVSIDGLRAKIFGTESYMSEIAKRGGQATSEIKAEAARNNGRLGGRPPSKVKLYWDRLKEVGITKQFVIGKLLPKELADEFEATKTTQAKEQLLYFINQHIKKIYHWDLGDILGAGQLVYPSSAGSTARFKMPGNVNDKKASAYVVYAHYLSLLAEQATSHLPRKLLEEDANKVIAILQNNYGGITLESTLRYLWDCGVVTFSLNDSGSFHGACWRFEGRNVIVLKQKTDSEYRTLFDLLHELDHVSSDQENANFTHLEAGETSIERRTSIEEQTASINAGYISLAGRAEELAQLCVDEAGGSIEGLKSAVNMIAMRENVNVSALANYLAFRLYLNGQNWWGAANNLQEKGNPGQLINSMFLKNANLESLNPFDRDMLVKGISE